MLSSAAGDDNEQFEQPLTIHGRTTEPTSTHPNNTISFPKDTSASSKSQDNPSSAGFRPPSPAPRFNGFSQNAAMNTKSLPPAPPRTTMPDFNTICNNYLAMLHTSPEQQQQALQAVAELAGTSPLSSSQGFTSDISTLASPEYQSLGNYFPHSYESQPLFGDDPMNADMSTDMDYLTSPQLDELATSPMDTPYSAFMPTPSLDMVGEFEEPAILTEMENELADQLLSWPEDGGDAVPTTDKLPTPPPTLPLDQMYTLSPSEPTIDLFNSPLPPLTPTPSASPSIPASPPRRRPRTIANATGTRKNMTTQAMIPYDAPTQTRTYKTVSATSRKAVPAGFLRSKKRNRSTAFGDDDHDDGRPASPTPSEVELIEHKRRQNTLAARKSRKLKLETQKRLEQTVADLEDQVLTWKTRACAARDLLNANGVPFQFDEAD
ncbi:BZIP domain-containing protein [Mycena indigotica]|uniref:BZIP domain-containing protein n=1 Tax=Mycena indigotica TaxID=2126181 RepID=A0A8H6SI25_9AGAR|nr:BZIP domain-containing protein [Mycena indigotica]KAF7298737.1 BZIP domain-containing protein [Mycena indigotica]